MKVNTCKEEVKLEKRIKDCIGRNNKRSVCILPIAICKLDKRGHQRCPEATTVCGDRHGDRGKVIVLANKGKWG